MNIIGAPMRRVHSEEDFIKKISTEGEAREGTRNHPAARIAWTKR